LASRREIALYFANLRRTFVAGLADLGIRPDVIEMAVNHASGLRGGIAGVGFPFTHPQLASKQIAPRRYLGSDMVRPLIAGVRPGPVHVGSAKPAFGFDGSLSGCHLDPYLSTSVHVRLLDINWTPVAIL
jgi:hypothetical protein